MRLLGRKMVSVELSPAINLTMTSRFKQIKPNQSGLTFNFYKPKVLQDVDIVCTKSEHRLRQV